MRLPDFPRHIFARHFGPIALAIDRTEKPEWLAARGLELVVHPRRHVHAVERGDLARALAQDHAARPAQHHHGVRVLVPLEGGVPARLDLEVASEEVERLLPPPVAEQRLTRHVLEPRVGALVRPHVDRLPAKRATLQDLRSIIHRSVASPPRVNAGTPPPDPAGRTGCPQSERWYPPRSGRSPPAPAPRRCRRRARERPA